MEKEREVLGRENTVFDALLDGTGNTDGNNERLESNAVELSLGFVDVETASEEDADESGASAVNGYVKVACSDSEIIKSSRTLIFKQTVHFFYTLTENGSLRVEVELAVKTECLLIKTDGERDSESVSVFESNGTFYSDNVGRKADVIIIGCHNGLELLKNFDVLAAECNLTLVVSYELVACAGTADSIDRALDSFFLETSLPKIGVGYKTSVGSVPKSFGDRKNGYVERNLGKNVVAKPIYAEAAYSADDHVGTVYCTFHILDLIIFHSFGKIAGEFGMTVGFYAGVDDLSVKGRTYKSYLVAVFSCRKGESRAHHTCAYNSNCCHISLQYKIKFRKLLKKFEKHAIMIKVKSALHKPWIFHDFSHLLLYYLMSCLSSSCAYFERFPIFIANFFKHFHRFSVNGEKIMIGFDRKENVLKYIEEKQSATVKELAYTLCTSEASIRRDIELLERDGLVKKVYGGVILASRVNDIVPLSLRDSENASAKEQIARKAAEMIGDDATIILDASSTARRIMKYIENRRNLRIFTNNLKIFSELGSCKAKIYCTGGAFSAKNNAFVGPMAEEFLRSVSADMLFFSSQGISEDGEISDVSEEETSIRRVMLSRAKYKVFLCDSSKVGVRRPFTLCTKDDVDKIISDTTLPWE